MEIPDLTHRRRRPELMDDPELPAVEHDRALRALARVNRVSGTVERIWSRLRALDGGGGPLKVLDVACGGGDVMVALARRARRGGVRLEVHGCDVSPAAVDRARAAARAAGVAGEFFPADALAGPLPGGYDLVVSTLFLHHLAQDDAVGLLGAMARAGRRILVQDLLRTRAGWLLAWGGLRLLSRSRVAHVDGPRSVEGAFTLDEVRGLAGRAGVADVHLARVWPERFLLEGGAG